MGVVSFVSLKGGVGKTSLSVNVAHAFANRGCETLLIDLDPMAHSSRVLSRTAASGQIPGGKGLSSPLGKLFLGAEEAGDAETEDFSQLIEQAISSNTNVVEPVRDHLSLISSGPELRHFFWGRGARAFRKYFSKLLDELSCHYDYVVIDTPPDYNVLTRNAIAEADLAVVPVDSSAMSIHCLEEILAAGGHIKGPAWLILRTMVSRQASRTQRMSQERLAKNLYVKAAADMDENDFEEEGSETDLSNPEEFLMMVERHQHRGGNGGALQSRIGGDNPIYLLNSIIYRTDLQNRLTFQGKTAFDSSEAAPLKAQYSEAARELEYILSMVEDHEEESNPESLFSLGLTA